MIDKEVELVIDKQEQYAIRCAFESVNYAIDLCETLDGNDFISINNGKIYECIKQLVDSGEVITQGNIIRLKKFSHFQQEVLSEILSQESKIKVFKEILKFLAEEGKSRRLDRICVDARKLVSEGKHVSVVSEKILQDILDLENRVSTAKFEKQKVYLMKH